MKKKLLATAIAATMAAPTAGFAQGAGPVLYGQVHVSSEYLDNDRTDDLNFSSNSSRIGVQGGFDLGQTFEGIYKMEWEVDITDATGDGGNKGRDLNPRDRFAGFKSATYGTFRLGRMDTPVKLIGRKVDLFWSTQLGQNRSLTAIRDAGGAGPGFDLRADNTFAIQTPNFGPVSLSVAYIADHNIRNETIASGKRDIQDDNSFDAWSGALVFNRNVFSATGDDNLYLAVGYEKHNVDFNNDVPANVNGLKNEESAFRAGAKLDIGNFTIAAFGQWAEDQGFINGADRNIYGGGLAYRLDRWTFKGQVYYADEIDSYNFGAGNRVDGSDSDAYLFALGIDHELSKNVQIYVQGAGIDSEENTFRPQFGGGLDRNNPTYFSLGGAGHGSIVSATPDETTWGISIGSRVKF